MTEATKMNPQEAKEAARFCDFLRGFLFVNLNDNNTDAVADAQRKLRGFHDIFEQIAEGNLEIRVVSE